MRLDKALLLFSGAIFAAYGVVCWYNPELPAEYAGLFIATHDGYAEMAAMYGGLQTGFGVLLILAGLVSRYRRAGLWVIQLGIGSLAIARGSVAFSDLDSGFNLSAGKLQLAMSSGFTLYTWGALAFEATIVLIATWCLIKGARNP
ncbi:MAG: hypothetical protein V2I45_07875 [Halieaceae bacterium]|jgi:hypothetical protein|nr:hypothetical protein [Halieaceae bacterium]